jgi:hypothetical protein
MGSSGSPELGSEECRKQRQKRRPPIRTSIIIDGPSIGAISAGGCALTRFGLAGHLTLNGFPGHTCSVPPMTRTAAFSAGTASNRSPESQVLSPGFHQDHLSTAACFALESGVEFRRWATLFFHGLTLFRTPMSTEPRADRPRRPHTPPSDAENGYG